MAFAEQVITAVVFVVASFSTSQAVRPYTVSGAACDNEYVINKKDNINFKDFILMYFFNSLNFGNILCFSKTGIYF